MPPATPRRWLLAHILALCVLLGVMGFPGVASAAQDDVTIELQPHCDGERDADNVFGGPVPDNLFMTKPLVGQACHDFEVKDPLTRQTPMQSAGDTLDMDLLIHNPRGEPIQRVRAWFAYDPSVLEGVSIEINPSFSRPSPEEQTFSPEDGYVKIGASTDNALTGTRIVVARIKMKVKPSTSVQTVISPYHPGPEATTETAVITVKSGQEQNLLRPPGGSLLVRLRGFGSAGGSQASAASSQALPPSPPASSAVSSIAAQSSVPASAASSAAQSSASAGTTIFPLLQVQNLRATTEGTTVYLAWDPLQSAELAGYNVYYGTTSGEYIQRRSVDKTSTTLTIRNLPAGIRYYFAVRGVSTKSEESEFSQEVAVTIGKPETSTAPLFGADLTGTDLGGKAPKTGGKVAGDTGIPSALLLFLAASAVIGTGLALRRQFAATSPALP